jgi:hypothetical protein
MRYGIGDSAFKHGASYEDIIHILSTCPPLGVDDSGLTWWCGTAATGIDYEIAGFETDDGAIFVSSQP